MAQFENCCCIFRVKDASIIIGFLSAAIAVAGLAMSILFFCGILKYPEDPFANSILHIMFFIGIPGIAFHAILLLFSLILMLGCIYKVQTLLVPWIAWTPFLIIAIVINIALSLEDDKSLAVPIVCFFLIILLLTIYACVVIVAYYKELTILESRMGFLNSTYPYSRQGTRIQRLFAMFQTRNGMKRVTSITASSEMPNSSTMNGPALNSSERDEMRDVLGRSYARLLTSVQATPLRDMP